MLTLEQVQDTLPVSSRSNMTQDMVDQLNNLSKHPEEARYIRDNFISFAQVLQDGRFKVGDYVSAVMFVSHKTMGKSNLESYKCTFPDRYQKMIDDGKERKDIASIITAYNKGMLVNKVQERAIVPSWILNQDMFQSALNVQHELMNDVRVSDKVRCEAANSLLTHLKKPENNKAEVKIDIALNDGMQALENSLTELAQKQLDEIENNPSISAQDIAGRKMKTIN
mgnify:CR=1 FL=1